MKGADFILELIFKGLLQWLFDMIINITEYLANSLLTIFSMDLSYFESSVPVTGDIVNIITGVGWALLIGNLVFQAAKSMVAGLGFDGEDPRTLFSRTFVMSFLLVASRQVCDIGLSITKNVIDLLQVPTIVQVPQLSESDFSVPGDAGWLLVIIIGIILVVQIIKLFFELGERYVIVAILTILSPLAFAMGGSKSTSDIFKGWVRMFSSMCLMMVLSVVFLKFILSAMSDVPVGVAIVPWTVFIVALARTGKKIDGLIARIGLNPAITGDPLGHSRMPGMLTYMMIRNMAGNIGKAASENKGGSAKADAARLLPLSGPASHDAGPARPPIGSSATKDVTVSPGHPMHGAAKPAESPTYKDTSHAPDLTSKKESGGGGTSVAKGTHGKSASGKSLTRPPIAGTSDKTSTDKPGVLGAHEMSPTDKPIAAKPFSASSHGMAAHDNPAAVRPSTANTSSTEDASSVLTKGLSTDAPKAFTPVAAKPTADIKSADKAKGGVIADAASKTGFPPDSMAKSNMPLTDKIRPANSSTDKTAGGITSRGENVKTAKDVLTEAGKATRPPHPTVGSAGALKSDAGIAKMPVSSRPSDASVIKEGDVSQKGGNISQRQTNATNVTFQQKAALPKHNPQGGATSTGQKPERPAGAGYAKGKTAEAEGEHSRPPIGKMPSVSKKDNSLNISKPPVNETPKTGGYSDSETSQAVHIKSMAERNIGGGAKDLHKSNLARPDNKSQNNETNQSKGIKGQTVKNTGINISQKSTGAASAINNRGVTNTTLSQAGKGYKQAQTSKGMINENQETLKNRPPYKPNSASKPSGKKEGENK